MTDLTQKILSLDVDVASKLNHANAVSMEAKREADLRVEQRIEEAQQLFERQKNSEARQFERSVKEDRERSLDNLRKKMKTFDKDVEINVLIEHLLIVAKDRICH